MLTTVAVCAMMGGVTQMSADAVVSFKTCYTNYDCEIYQPTDTATCTDSTCSCGYTANEPEKFQQCFPQSQPGVYGPSNYDMINMVWAMTHATFEPEPAQNYVVQRIVDCDPTNFAKFATAYKPEVQKLLPSSIKKLDIRHICYTSSVDQKKYIKSMIKFDAPASLLTLSKVNSLDGGKIRNLAKNINLEVLKPAQPASLASLRAGGVIIHAQVSTTQALKKCLTVTPNAELSVAFTQDSTVTDYLTATPPTGCTPMICPRGKVLTDLGDGMTDCLGEATTSPTSAPTTTAPATDDVTRSVTVQLTVTGDIDAVQNVLTDLQLAIGVGFGASEGVACQGVCRKSVHNEMFYDSECLSDCTATWTEPEVERVDRRSVEQLALRRWQFTFTGTTIYTHELSLQRISEGIKGVLGDMTINNIVIIEPDSYRDFSDDELSDGAIAGIVIGCTLFLCIVICIIYMFCCKDEVTASSKREELEAESASE